MAQATSEFAYTVQITDVFSSSEWVDSYRATRHFYKAFRGRFLQARWPNQQRQNTERTAEISHNPTRITPLF